MISTSLYKPVIAEFGKLNGADTFLNTLFQKVFTDNFLLETANFSMKTLSKTPTCRDFSAQDWCGNEVDQGLIGSEFDLGYWGYSLRELFITYNPLESSAFSPSQHTQTRFGNPLNNVESALVADLDRREMLNSGKVRKLESQYKEYLKELHQVERGVVSNQLQKVLLQAERDQLLQDKAVDDENNGVLKSYSFPLVPNDTESNQLSFYLELLLVASLGIQPETRSSHNPKEHSWQPFSSIYRYIQPVSPVTPTSPLPFPSTPSSSPTPTQTYKIKAYNISSKTSWQFLNTLELPCFINNYHGLVQPISSPIILQPQLSFCFVRFVVGLLI